MVLKCWIMIYLIIIHRHHRLRVAASVYVFYGWKTHTFKGVNDGSRSRLITRWRRFAFTVFWRKISWKASPFGEQTTLLFSTVHRLRHVVKLRTPDHRNTGTPEHRNTKTNKDQRRNKWLKTQLRKRFGFLLASLTFLVSTASAFQNRWTWVTSW